MMLARSWDWVRRVVRVGEGGRGVERRRIWERRKEDLEVERVVESIVTLEEEARGGKKGILRWCRCWDVVAVFSKWLWASTQIDRDVLITKATALADLLVSLSHPVICRGV